jgi:hypothetical protein
MSIRLQFKTYWRFWNVKTQTINDGTEVTDVRFPGLLHLFGDWYFCWKNQYK